MKWLLIFLLLIPITEAYTTGSTNYQMNITVINPGGNSSSNNYGLRTDISPFTENNTASANYQLCLGFLCTLYKPVKEVPGVAPVGVGNLMECPEGYELAGNNTCIKIVTIVERIQQAKSLWWWVLICLAIFVLLANLWYFKEEIGDSRFGRFATQNPITAKVIDIGNDLGNLLFIRRLRNTRFYNNFIFDAVKNKAREIKRKKAQKQLNKIKEEEAQKNLWR
jgi:hypothetical protein